MAGAGYKLFNTGDVLTAAQVNTYLMEQTVMVFANATARTSALSGVLAEGMVSYLQDTNALEVYNGSAWVGAGSAGDIEGVTAGVGISGGGTSGTVTITNSMATAIDAKGDLIVGTGADTFSRLAVGTNGHTLVADSATATGLKWAAPSSGSSTMVSVATGTLSTGTTTISSLTSYDTIFVLLYDIAQSVDSQVFFRINGSSSSVYASSRGLARLGTTSGSYYNGSDTRINLGSNGGTFNNNGESAVAVLLTNCKEAGFTMFQSFAAFREDSGSQIWQAQAFGVFETNAAVSSISVVSSGSSFTGGNYYVYGA